MRKKGGREMSKINFIYVHAVCTHTKYAVSTTMAHEPTSGIHNVPRSPPAFPLVLQILPMFADLRVMLSSTRFYHPSPTPSRGNLA